MTGKRHLAAIMFTDMVGFTASAQTDEVGALKRLHEQERLVRSLLAAHRGREIKSTGDGFLVEFDSALRATECGIAIQRRIHERNSTSNLAPIELRIGVHLGDVERRKGDIFGDAVNVASRVGPCASPGGICISGPVFDQIRNKIPNRLEKLDPRALKGLQRAIDVYRIALQWDGAQPPRALSGPPRLAVLPLANISPDPNDEYFADGLTEEVINALSKLRELRVIARTSVAQYKSAPKSVSQIGAELGVTSVLEGSVRKAGNRLRITLQLIDVGTQEHVWAGSYDRELDDVFAVQADIAKQVADTLRLEVRAADQTHADVRPNVRTDSYLAYLKGRTLLHDRSADALHRAKEQFELAISMDSKNAAALSGLSDVTRLIGAIHRDSPLADWDEASLALAQRAVELDPNLAEAHTSLGYSLWSDYKYSEAETEFRLAISLSPSYPAAHQWYSVMLAEQDRFQEALAQIAIAEQADPRSSIILRVHASLLIALRRLDAAHAKLEQLGGVEEHQELYHGGMAEYYMARSDFPRALQEIKLRHKLRPERPEDAVDYGICYAAMGQAKRAREYLHKLERRKPGQRPESGIAAIYACLGEIDRCLPRLERGAFENYDLDVLLWRTSPLFEGVRKDPRFAKILQRMNLA